MELKDRIQFILDDLDMKQKDLAEAVKVSESYVSNLVNGNRPNISETLALLIEQTYGYSAQWVLGRGTAASQKETLPICRPPRGG